VAVWDAWDQQWYVDQLDVGRGRKVRLKVHGGVIEGRNVIDAADELGVRLCSGVQVVRGGGRSTKLALDAILERMSTTTLLDIVMACGPRTIVVMEDFLIGQGAGEGMMGAEFGRDGLSPVRMIARFQSMAEDHGLWNGDAWREFDCGWWTGGDSRGVSVVNKDPVGGGNLHVLPSFLNRLTRVERWRLGEVVSKRGYEAVGMARAYYVSDPGHKG
jgi:hypothetical protein